MSPRLSMNPSDRAFSTLPKTGSSTEKSACPDACAPKEARLLRGAQFNNQVAAFLGKQEGFNRFCIAVRIRLVKLAGFGGANLYHDITQNARPAAKHPRQRVKQQR